LIVEDEPTIALTYSVQLNGIGARAEGVRATNRGALDFLAKREVDAAIVDYWLADGASNPVIYDLHARGIPFIIVTAWPDEVRAAVNSAHVLTKPVSEEALVEALLDVLT
jgi:DNA-binding response OmpR family regulator